MSLVERSDRVLVRPLPADSSRSQSFLRQHVALIAVLALGLLVRMVVLFVYLETHDWKGETWEHETIAMNLWQGKGFMMVDGPIVYRSREPPFFGFLCYALHVLGGPSLGLFYLFQLAMAGGVIALTYAIAHRWFDRRVAVAAALLVALEPGLVIYHSYKVDDLAFATGLILLAILAMLRLTQSHSTPLAAAVGVLIGVGVLTRPDLISLLGMVLVWPLLERTRFADALKPAAVVLLTATLIIAPWALRNSLLHGKVVLLTTFSGEALWRGNNPNSTGSAASIDGRSQFSAAPSEFRQKVLAANEVDRDALFREDAVRFIVAHPGAFLERVLNKIYYFWWFTPTYGTQHYGWVPSPLKDAYRVGYGVMLAFALAGLWHMVREGLTVPRVLLLSVPLWLAVVHGLSYVEGRHRVLVMPLILIAAAHGMIVLSGLAVGFLARRSS